MVPFFRLACLAALVLVAVSSWGIAAPPRPIVLSKGLPITRVQSSGELQRLEGSPDITALNLARAVLDKDLVHLANLPNLRKLELMESKVTNQGIEYLTTLPHLTALQVNANTTDAAMPYIARLADLEELDLAIADKVTDEGLKHIAGLTKLKRLELPSFSGITNAGFKHIAGLTKLEILDITGVQVTDDGFALIANFPDLVSLRMRVTSYRMAVSAKSLQHLAALRNLKRLDVSGSIVTDEGLQELGKLTQLEELYVVNGQFSDDALRHLAGLTQLRVLDLSHNFAIGGEGLKHIGTLTTLQRLELGQTKVTDQGLAHLGGLTNLESLNLADTEVTGKGCNELLGLSRLKRLNIAQTPAAKARPLPLQNRLANLRIVRR